MLKYYPNFIFTLKMPSDFFFAAVSNGGLRFMEIHVAWFIVNNFSEIFAPSQ